MIYDLKFIKIVRRAYPFISSRPSHCQLRLNEQCRPHEDMFIHLRTLQDEYRHIHELHCIVSGVAFKSCEVSKSRETKRCSLPYFYFGLKAAVSTRATNPNAKLQKKIHIQAILRAIFSTIRPHC